MKVKVLISVACAVIALVGSAGCGRGGGEVLEEKEVRHHAASELDPAIVEAANRFGLALYGRMAGASPSENNLLLSPLSVSAALALVASGAKNETEDEMKRMLGLEHYSSESIGSGYRVFLDLLNHPQDDGIGLTFASSLWLSEKRKFNSKFIDDSMSNFAAETFPYDALSSSAAKRMNDWAAKKTNGAIKKVIDQVDQNSVMYVLNAIDFDGAWTTPFRPEATSRAKFYPTGFPSEGDYFVRMMSQGGMYEYGSMDGYEIIRLPIGRHGSAYMAVILPAKVEGALAKLQANIVSDLSLLTGKLDIRQGTIELPKTKFDYATNINDSLKALGMNAAFDSLKASFPGIAEPLPDMNVFIGRVNHSTSFDMNEDGVSASAVTMIEAMAGAAPPSPEGPFRMTVDRPFIVSIIDRETGSILFVGTVAHPNAD
ncbi:serpin family protein [Cohnella soli]|uniref:Serpin family protein n=1 Tax=Cohnella soli TaxID=425005 RepID=A0ABW0HTX8_9BACL